MLAEGRTNLGGSGRGNHFNNNFPISFIIFPKTSTSAANRPAAIRRRHQLPGHRGHVAAVPGRQCARPRAAARLQRSRSAAEAAGQGRPRRLSPGPPPTVRCPRNYATLVQGLGNFGFNVREGQAQATGPGVARAVSSARRRRLVDQLGRCRTHSSADRKRLLGHCRGDGAGLEEPAIGFAGAAGQLQQHGQLAPRRPHAVGQAGVYRGDRPDRPSQRLLHGRRLPRDSQANGPVWVTADVPGIHAIVVTGMYRQDGRYYVRITDPWDRVVGSPGAPGSYADTHVTGSQYIMSSTPSPRNSRQPAISIESSRAQRRDIRSHHQPWQRQRSRLCPRVERRRIERSVAFFDLASIGARGLHQ